MKVLYYPGSFFPIHYNHKHLVYTAIDWVTKNTNDNNIIVHIALCHSKFIAKKLGLSPKTKDIDLPLNNSDRLILCQNMFEDYNKLGVTIIIDDSLMKDGMTMNGYHRKLIELYKDQDIQLRQICGPDSYALNKNLNPLPLCIINRYTNDKPVGENGIFITNINLPISSSLIRNQIRNEYSLNGWMPNENILYLKKNYKVINDVVEEFDKSSLIDIGHIGSGAQGIVRMMFYCGIPVAVKFCEIGRSYNISNYHRECEILEKLERLEDFACHPRLFNKFMSEKYVAFIMELGIPYDKVFNIINEDSRKCDISSDIYSDILSQYEKAKDINVLEKLINIDSVGEINKKQLCCDLINSIMAIHKLSMLHRDLKLDNLILVNDIKLSNLGLNSNKNKYRLVITDFACSNYNNLNKIRRGRISNYPKEGRTSYNKYIYDNISEISSLCVILHNITNGTNLNILEIKESNDYIMRGISDDRNNRPSLEELLLYYSS